MVMFIAPPKGFRDYLPQDALQREQIVRTVANCFAQAGYLPVELPLLDVSAAAQNELTSKVSAFEVFDEEGTLLSLRSDITNHVARMVARLYQTNDLPVKLRYSATVARRTSTLLAHPREVTQLGVEHYAAGTSDEHLVSNQISLLTHVLETLSLKSWKVSVASVKPLQYLIKAFNLEKSAADKLLSLVHQTNLIDAVTLIKSLSLSTLQCELLCKLITLQGSLESLLELQTLFDKLELDAIQAGMDELVSLANLFGERVQKGQFTFDFSIINSFDYYTGVIFKAYTPLVKEELATGGRYDALMQYLGRPEVSACGFACSLEALQQAWDLGKAADDPAVNNFAIKATTASTLTTSTPVTGAHKTSAPATSAPATSTPATSTTTNKYPLRIAVPKGSLFEPTRKLLQQAGLPVNCLRDLGRKLIVREQDVEYLVVRAQDAPAFVAQGAADCGICGFDSLVEANYDLIQLIDLGFGECRFVVAAPTAQQEEIQACLRLRGSVLQRGKTLRVATKYPRITQTYFDHLQVPVEIVHLHGNIELGPLVGMTDAIVDITATGTTLKENDLAICSDVMSSRARFFVNTVAYRTNPQVEKVSALLTQAIRTGHNA